MPPGRTPERARLRRTLWIAVHTALQPVRPDGDAQMTAYRRVQESLTNIARYAQASEVSISLPPQGGQVPMDSTPGQGCHVRTWLPQSCETAGPATQE